jgi:hypothetical protein
MKLWILWTALLLAALQKFSVAQDSSPEALVTDRPDFTESTETVKLGRLQLEGGYTFTRVSNNKEHTLGELLLRVGAWQRLELRIGINSYALMRSPSGNASGFHDVLLGVKAKLVQGSERFGLNRPNVAVIVATTLPTGSDAFRETQLQPEVRIALGLDLSTRLALASNLNYAYASEEAERFSQFSGSISFGYTLTERSGTYLEYFSFVPSIKEGPNSKHLNAGLTYLVNYNYQLDVRVGIGLNGETPDYFFGFGASWRWGDKR